MDICNVGDLFELATIDRKQQLIESENASKQATDRKPNGMTFRHFLWGEIANCILKQALKNASHSCLMWDAEVVSTPLMARVLIAIIIYLFIHNVPTCKDFIPTCKDFMLSSMKVFLNY